MKKKLETFQIAIAIICIGLTIGLVIGLVVGIIHDINQ